MTTINKPIPTQFLIATHTNESLSPVLVVILMATDASITLSDITLVESERDYTGPRLGKYIPHCRKLLRKKTCTNFKDTDSTAAQEEIVPPLSVLPPSYKDHPPLKLYTWQQTHDISMETSTAVIAVLHN